MKLNFLRDNGRSGTRRAVAVVGALVVGAGVIAFAGTQASAAASGCSVTYSVVTQWDVGFTADIKVTNTGDPITSWTLKYGYSAGQALQSGWNGEWSQAGANVTVTSETWNGALATGATVDMGANFGYSGTNPAPTSFSFNGVQCGTGGTTPPPPTTTTAAPPPTTTTVAPPPPTSSTVTPPPTTTTAPPPPPGTHVADPFTGAVSYLNPDFVAEVNANATTAAQRSVGSFPTAIWLDTMSAIAGGGTTGRTGLAAQLDNALAKTTSPETVEIVVYDLPGRDCAALASNGEIPATAAGLTTYESSYIDPIASILSQPKYADSNLRIVAIIEPDSLPNVVTNQSMPHCATSTPFYEQGITYALNKLHAVPNVYNYLDIAHSAWLGWPDNMTRTPAVYNSVVQGTTAGYASIDGFISDTANYTPTQEPFLTNPNLNVGGQQLDSALFYQFNPTFDELSYDTAMYNTLVGAGFPASKRFLIDTSRNGWGGPNRPTALNSTPTNPQAYVQANAIDKRPFRGDWCNQNGAGIGARPTDEPMGTSSPIEAFVWIKPPGESDGDFPSASHSHGDPHCDPAGTNTDGNGGTYSTGSIPGFDVPAGQFFPAEFQMLVANAFPSLS
ncbi:MAG TPA: glycoside hydrolase family 6 protein [Pseudonocardiaceae bacterium]|jgi:cellulose 1,4-beta-cellobiosidase|nr:glycoside hydrolase family 6 protein [Pseudonocardiaceae bacterium]